jgi:hypothetical protein
MTHPVLVRNIRFELNVGTTADPDWVWAEGIDNVSHTPQTNRADARVFEDGGWLSSQIASRGHQFTFGGKKMLNKEDGSRPPGQEAIEQWGRDMGSAANRAFRILDQSDDPQVILHWMGNCEVQLAGGGIDDKDQWSFTVETTGPPLAID